MSSRERKEADTGDVDGKKAVTVGNSNLATGESYFNFEKSNSSGIGRNFSTQSSSSNMEVQDLCRKSFKSVISVENQEHTGGHDRGFDMDSNLFVLESKSQKRHILRVFAERSRDRG